MTEPQTNLTGDQLHTPPKTPFDWAALLLGLSAVAGLAISIYLTVAHYSGGGLACPRGGALDCEAVTHSLFSTVPGTDLPITIPGLIWFVVSGGAALLALTRRAPAWLAVAHLLWGVIGIFTILYLIYAELVVIHKVCLWCTTIHTLVAITFLLALIRWQRQVAEAI
ncbi:MAG: vitamin K epoxide reductase family protein [Candidatus Dormibacteraceae bacterium]